MEGGLPLLLQIAQTFLNTWWRPVPHVIPIMIYYFWFTPYHTHSHYMHSCFRQTHLLLLGTCQTSWHHVTDASRDAALNSLLAIYTPKVGDFQKWWMLVYCIDNITRHILNEYFDKTYIVFTFKYQLLTTTGNKCDFLFTCICNVSLQNGKSVGPAGCVPSFHYQPSFIH